MKKVVFLLFSVASLSSCVSVKEFQKSRINDSEMELNLENYNLDSDIKDIKDIKDIINKDKVNTSLFCF